MSKATVVASEEYNINSQAINIIDGSNRTDLNDCDCCYASNGSGNGWLHVDLGAVYPVAVIEIFGRTDGKCNLVHYWSFHSEVKVF